MSLSPTEYRDLIRTALPAAMDADTLPLSIQTLYTPESHRDSLDPDATLVIGGRGVGKSVWYAALLDEAQRGLAAADYQLRRLEKVVVHQGFSLHLSNQYPSGERLLQLADEGVEAEAIWATVVVQALAPDRVPEVSWSERVAWLRANSEVLDEVLLAADERSGRDGPTRLFVFDGLDGLHAERAETDRLAAGILRLGLRLRTSTRSVRAKVFMRPDMVDASLQHFRDASKLRANATHLSWTPMSLYALLFHWLGNADHELVGTFRRGVFDGREWDGGVAGRFSVPARLRSDRIRQREIVTTIAGSHMGTNARRGSTYTWLPNHLMDGNGQVSPRSFLSAVRWAAGDSRDHHGGHDRALHWEAIKAGVQHASRIRVDEIEESIPWVPTLVRPLRGRQVPIEQSVVEDVWTDVAVVDELTGAGTGEGVPPQGRHAAGDETDVRTGPRSTDHESLVEELIEIGVMTRRDDGRLDLPDVYRVAFGLGRRGGVKRVPR